MEIKTNDATKVLLKALEGHRIKRQMSQRAFGLFLGIDPALWHRIRTGKRTLTLNTLQIFMQNLPEITPEITIFFMSQGDDGKSKKTLSKRGVKN